jgi:hypothetical protein
MAQGQVVTSPDGQRWRVRRRWMDRGVPKLRSRFRKSREESRGDGILDGLFLPDVFDGGLAGLAILVVAAAIAIVVVVVLLPLIGLVLELLLLLLLLSSGVFGRVVLGRPWTVEAIDLDDGERSVAYAVKGFRRAGQAVEELANAVAADGPPERLTAGERTTIPRPGS